MEFRRVLFRSEGYRASRSATGSKTDTPILELPASVQVVPRQVIEDQGALNLKDVYENVSSVQQAGNTLNAQAEVLPIIRGFESPTLLRNGLRATTAGTVDLASVERVEVLTGPASIRSEEHTSELQSLMRNSYAVFCLKKKKQNT